MRLKAFLVPLAAFALSGCAGWFGHEHHRGPMAGGGPQDWHPPRGMLVKYDSNHDGTLTRAELEAGLKADFDAADTNHDGRLDINEVRAVNQARWSADSSATSPLVDWNHDGYVDFNEFAATPRSLFDQMDVNADGKLTPDELNPQAKAKGPNGGQRQMGGHHGRSGGDQNPDGGDEGPDGD
jgi:Ca2+-binding EF-hand superfamily protein